MATKYFDISGELIEKLLCDFCGQYLSSGPVLMDLRGQNMCGRCSNKTDMDLTEFHSNYVYEILANLVYFPCKNYGAGCMEKLKFSTTLEHEEVCSHNSYVCPLSKTHDCKWFGKLNELEAHYSRVHPDLIVKHPYKTKPDISKTYQEVLLLNDFNYNFLLQVKTNTNIGRFWHSIIILAQPTIANLFEYAIKIGKEKSYNIKSKPVGALVGKLFEDECIENTVSFLQTDLGEYDELNLELR